MLSTPKSQFKIDFPYPAEVHSDFKHASRLKIREFEVLYLIVYIIDEAVIQ